MNKRFINIFSILLCLILTAHTTTVYSQENDSRLHFSLGRMVQYLNDSHYRPTYVYLSMLVTLASLSVECFLMQQAPKCSLLPAYLIYHFDDKNYDKKVQTFHKECMDICTQKNRDTAADIREIDRYKEIHCSSSLCKYELSKLTEKITEFIPK